jgi:NitT/TauT family transport system permease protein
MRFSRTLAVFAGIAAILAIALPLGVVQGALIPSWASLPTLGYLVVVLALLAAFRLAPPPLVAGLLAVAGGAWLIGLLGPMQSAGGGYWCLLLTAWLLAWLFAQQLAIDLSQQHKPSRLLALLIPIMFGAAILVAWEAGTRGGNVPPVLLPSPSAIWARITNNLPMLGADFQQTFLKAVLAGYVIGNAVGLAIAIAIDRSPFLKRGLLPIGNFVSALPLVGIAPIMVMWFGFDWPSKAAVVVVMTFFPMLVNAVAGLNVTVSMERDLMRSYASNYWQTLFKLRLPAAAPFIFNALKINSTLALIGAIVAEFFGTPVVGMGFRISTAVGRMDIDLVWAEIAVSALAGSVFYGVVALIERAVTFWHPSVRGGEA